MSGLEVILPLLPKLTKDERVQVMARLKLLDSSASNESASTDWLREGLTQHLKSVGAWSGSGPIPNAIIPTAYTSKAEELRAFLLQGAGADLSTAHQLALGRMAGDVLGRWLRGMNRPVTINTLFSAVSQLGPALEEAFPGYWRSGMLGLCIGMSGETINSRGRRKAE